MTAIASPETSWLASAGESPWSDRPFFDETITLLCSVRDHDFDPLALLCADDFGIVDLDQSGSSVLVRTRYSAVEFRQSLRVGEHTGQFECVNTIILEADTRGVARRSLARLASRPRSPMSSSLVGDPGRSAPSPRTHNERDPRAR